MLPPLPTRKSYDNVPRDSLAYALFLNPLMEVDPLDNNNDEPPTLKTLTARLKHLPGKHDQSTHGKPGRVGSAFRGAYSAARAGGASHVEARNQAKTAAEQVRQTMRGEKREQVAKRAAQPESNYTKAQIQDFVKSQRGYLARLEADRNLVLARMEYEVGEGPGYKRPKQIQDPKVSLNEVDAKIERAKLDLAELEGLKPKRVAPPLTEQQAIAKATRDAKKGIMEYPHKDVGLQAPDMMKHLREGGTVESYAELEKKANANLTYYAMHDKETTRIRNEQRQQEVNALTPAQRAQVAEANATPLEFNSLYRRDGSIYNDAQVGTAERIMLNAHTELRAARTPEQAQQRLDNFNKAKAEYDAVIAREQRDGVTEIRPRTRTTPTPTTPPRTAPTTPVTPTTPDVPKSRFGNLVSTPRPTVNVNDKSTWTPELQSSVKRAQDEHKARVETLPVVPRSTQLSQSHEGATYRAEVAYIADRRDRQIMRALEQEKEYADPSLASNRKRLKLLAEHEKNTSAIENVMQSTGYLRSERSGGIANANDLMARNREIRAELGRIGASYSINKNGVITTTTTKADDSVGGVPRKYGVRAGEVIAGHLGRDTGGKFTRVGNEGTIVRAAINRGIAAAGGGKRGAKRAAVSAAQKRRQMADTGAGVMDKIGLDASDWDYLASDKPQDATDPQFTRLIELGLMDNVDGMAYPSALGRKVASAAGAGNEDKAKELLARDTAKRSARQAKMDAQISAYDEVINDKTASPRTRAIAARKRAVLIGQSRTSTKASDGYAPPDGVRIQAKRGLALRSEFGRGGTSVGIARARDLSNGKSMSRDTIMRMVSFFARHAVDKRPDWSNPSKPSNGYIAHLLWGGDAGKSWANKIANQIKAGE